MDITADLVGNNLNWDGYGAESVSIKGHLPWRGDSGTLAVQGQQVEHVLQLVALGEDLVGHRGGHVSRVVRAEPVGFVVEDVPTAVVLEGQVDKALEKALQTVELQPAGGLAQRLGQTVGRIAEDMAQALHLQVADREGEAQLGQAPRRIEAGQRQALAIQGRAASQPAHDTLAQISSVHSVWLG